jgi:hypothetical protein
MLRGGVEVAGAIWEEEGRWQRRLWNSCVQDGLSDRPAEHRRSWSKQFLETMLAL